MKKIIAKVKLKEDFVNRFEELAKEMVVKSRNEKDCIEYNLFKDTEEPLSFLFYEKYSSQEGIDFHFSTPHFKAFMDEVKPNFTEEPVIDIY